MIEEALPQDDQPIRDLIAVCPEEGLIRFGFQLTDSAFKFRDRCADRRFIVYRDGGRVIGMVVVDVEPVRLGDASVRAGYISALRVHPEYRRQGLGGRLILAAKRMAQELGAPGCFAAILDGNRPSLNSFYKAGFTSLRPIRYTSLVPDKQPLPTSPVTFRPAHPEEWPLIADKVTLTYGTHQLWPTEPYLSRLPQLPDRPTLYVGVRDQNVVASLAARDLSSLLQPSILAVHPMMKLVNWSLGTRFEVGRPLRTLLIDDVWGENDRIAADLVRWVARQASGSVEMVALFGDPQAHSDRFRARLKGFGGRLIPVVTRDLAVPRNRPLYLPAF